MGQKQSYSLNDSKSNGIQSEVAYTYDTTTEPVPVHMKPVSSSIRLQSKPTNAAVIVEERYENVVQTPKQVQDELSLSPVIIPPEAANITPNVLTETLRLDSDLLECPLVLEKENIRLVLQDLTEYFCSKRR